LNGRKLWPAAQGFLPRGSALSEPLADAFNGFQHRAQGIYTTLLKKFLEQEIGQAFAPTTNYSNFLASPSLKAES
jgi:hypothetical protein